MVEFLEKTYWAKNLFFYGNQRMNNIENFFDTQDDNFRVVEVYKSYCDSKYFKDFDIALFLALRCKMFRN